jgi:hypothetical protein
VDKLQLDTRDSDGGGGSHVTTDDDGAGDLYSLPVILHKALLAPLNAQLVTCSLQLLVLTPVNYQTSHSVCKLEVCRKSVIIFSDSA